MLEQVIPVGTRTGASSPKISSTHLWSVQLWPTSLFLETVTGERMLRAWSELVPTASTAQDVLGPTLPLHVLLCTKYIREVLSPNPLLGCWPLSFKPELSYSDDPCPELAELPSECPYGEEFYCGFQRPHWLMYLPISLDSASQRAQATLWSGLLM